MPPPRNEEHLIRCLHLAKTNGYALGAKLVRGAYHVQEVEAHVAARSSSPGKAHSLSISLDEQPPVWSTKAETDACYHACTKILLDAIADDITYPPVSHGFFSSLFGKRMPNAPSTPSVGVLFGTHNWDSCRFILDGLVERGLARKEGLTASGEPVLRISDEVSERLTMAQLYGMHDNLTDYLVERTRTSAPFVIKYVPYGALAEVSSARSHSQLLAEYVTQVLPYLGRRAIENKSVLGAGAAEEERDRAWAGIKRIIFG